MTRDEYRAMRDALMAARRIANDIIGDALRAGDNYGDAAQVRHGIEDVLIALDERAKVAEVGTDAALNRRLGQ